MDLFLVPRLIIVAQTVVEDSLSRCHQVLSSAWILALGFVDELVVPWPASITLFAMTLNYRLPV